MIRNPEFHYLFSFCPKNSPEALAILTNNCPVCVVDMLGHWIDDQSVPHNHDAPNLTNNEEMEGKVH